MSEPSAASAQAPTGIDDFPVPPEALLAATVADEKLGIDTLVLAMGELFGMVDAFVVTSGRNARHVRSLVEEIEARIKLDDGRAPARIEGLREGTWVLMDYGDFLVHVFATETRDFYDLEHLWAGAPRLSWHEGAPRL